MRVKLVTSSTLGRCRRRRHSAQVPRLLDHALLRGDQECSDYGMQERCRHLVPTACAKAYERRNLAGRGVALDLVEVRAEQHRGSSRADDHRRGRGRSRHRRVADRAGRARLNRQQSHVSADQYQTRSSRKNGNFVVLGPVSDPSLSLVGFTASLLLMCKHIKEATAASERLRIRRDTPFTVQLPECTENSAKL